MKKERYLFTSESVTEGHPDKICDQVSDAVLDAIMAEDPNGRVAVETLVTTGMVVVTGEVTTKTYVDIPKLVRATLKDIGYTEAALGFDYQSCGVLTAIQQQSPDISMGVDTGGAGDQGMMFGYACRETPELMPIAITLAHRITRQLAQLRKTNKLKYLWPDGKAQVTVEYENGRPLRIDAIVISTHHRVSVATSTIRKDLIKNIVKNPAIIPQKMVDKNTKIFVNPTGRFEVGGPVADTGLTGRKIIVDTYGGAAPHGGGAFSGKDPSKVDRSACYMARYIAKNVVAANLADRCEVQVAYAIGVREPVSVLVNTFGTGKVSSDVLESAVRKTFDLTPHGIIKTLDLRKPIYRKTAAYGHFGRSEKGFTWERTDKVQDLKRHSEERIRSNGHSGAALVR
ncbi:MAG: methionine adenosyltransferase [Candidatus Omnitrophica bacterium]|jgi:S-adenosylmethionine synthetase|nr:methionine adenosyltransferase [Candidatus Omnitrophota bacterium]